MIALDLFLTRATIERAFVDRFHARWDRHAFQGSALIESAPADFGHSAGYRHVREFSALPKRTIPDGAPSGMA